MKFVLVVLINILPIGLLIFDFSTQEVLFAYWLEMIGFIVLYSVACLFASPAHEDEENTPLTVSIPLVSNRPGSVQPTKYIPPIYYKNTKYTTGGVFFGGTFWALSGTLLIDYANPTPQIDGGRFDRPIGEYITTLSSAATTEAIFVGLALCIFQLILVSLFVNKNIEHFTGATVAEIPSNAGLYWFLTIAFLGTIIVITTSPIIYHGNIGMETGAEIRALLLFIIPKTILEWAMFRTRHRMTPGPISRWLMPHDPTNENQS